MERTLIILSMTLCSLFSAVAKEIKGTVTDVDSIPIEFANITAFAVDSVVGGGVTDALGNFRIEVGSDCNRIRVSAVGYGDMVLSAIKSDIGKVILKKGSTTLREVVVKGARLQSDSELFL